MGLLSPLLLTFIITLSFLSETESASFEIVNKCNYTIWPGILSNAGSVAPSTTGFTLKSGASFNLSVHDSWGGRVWGRTLCNESSTGNFSCFTGDCGSLKIECDGNGASPPATLAEFTLGGLNRTDFYDVSVVDGFNLPMVVEPHGGNCSSLGCPADLNGACPKELRVAREGSQETLACKSPCEVFQNELFCCSGKHGTAETCAGTVYSDYFKQACPQAYTYAYDDNQTAYKCASANYYSIVFCPIRSAEEPSVIQHVRSISKNHKIIIASIASVAGIVILIFLTVLASMWRSKRKRQQGIQLELEDGQRFTYSELVKITNNFASPIGAGGFGKVYHGILENDVQVAVKLLISASDSSEYKNEVKLLMRAHHKNVVSFVGYCNERQTMALVFEYIANGNLQQHLTVSATGTILTWKERLQIAMNAAQGKLNKKSDIYSFGVVLLELITGKTAIITDVEPGAIHICQWVRPMFERTDIEGILDIRIKTGTYNVSSAGKAVGIAMECVSSKAIERPDISVVYKELKECLEIEVPPEIATVAEVDENDNYSTSSSNSFHLTAHIESESFLVHMNSHNESEIERHTC